MPETELSPSEFREIWDAKPALRAVYRDYYDRMEAWRQPGVTVEIGAGSGNLHEEMEGVFSSDIAASELLDMALDAQALPFADGSVSTFVGVDVLHHIEFPRHFLVEAARALDASGRIVLVEPAITPVSRIMFKVGHPEPVDMSVDPLADGQPDPAKHPFDSNQALPTLIANRHRGRLGSEVGMRVVHAEYLSLAAYPLSGGFRPWSLIPTRAVNRILRVERRMERRVGRLAGFRLLLVLERSDD